MSRKPPVSESLNRVIAAARARIYMQKYTYGTPYPDDFRHKSGRKGVAKMLKNEFKHRITAMLYSIVKVIL